MISATKKILANFIMSRSHLLDFADLWAVFQIEKFGFDDLAEYRLSRLRRILICASRTVPYWQKLFKSLGLDEKKLNNFTMDDFVELPILLRPVLRDRIEEFCAGGFKNIKHAVDTTSGSSGVPLKILIDCRAVKRRIAIRKRYMSLCGLGKIKNFGNLWYMAALKDLGICINVNSFRGRYGELAKMFVRMDIKNIGGVLSNLIMLAENLDRHKLDLKLELVFSSAEHLSSGTREYLENVFGCPVYSQYGCVELGFLGQECKLRDGFHVNTANILVEIVDENALPVSDGRIGRILVTSFDNNIMPLVRYELGDLGKWLEGDCACGLKTPRIYFEGRALHFLRLPDGGKYPVLNIMNLFDLYYQKYIKQVQIIQESLDKIILRIVPTDNYESRGDVFFIRAALDRINCGKPISVSVEKAAEIPKLPSGKSQVFISKIN